jgi:two-component system sensor histidine kinase TctE
MTRPDRPTPSVSRRLLGLLLLPLALLLGTGVFIDYRTGSAPIRAAYDRALHEMALAVAAHLRDADADGRIDADLPPQAIAVLRADSVDAIYFVVRAADGHVVNGDGDLLPAADMRHEFSDGMFRGEAIRMVTHPARIGHTTVTITIAETTRKRAAAIRSILTSIVLTDIVQLGGTLLLVWIGVRYGVRPLRALGDQIAQRSARDLAPLDRDQIPTEVRPLVNTLNALFETVRDNARAQQQFLADAAHQLRTPLSGIIAQLDLLARDAGGDDGLGARLRALHDGTRRLAHTANQLLALARSERSATTRDDFHVVDLESLATDAVAQYLDRSLLAHIDLGAETAPARTIGSSWLLRELLGNLVDNALTYTPAGGRVTVRSGKRAGNSFIEVEDDGPGIPVEERTRVRERFRRLPGSRGNGCGLGLAIVDEIAHAHDAAFSIEAGADGRGTRSRIEFRASP